jgi:hypothetical protein
LILEIQEGVELHTCLGSQLRHSIFSIHLVTLLGHFELIRHVV